VSLPVVPQWLEWAREIQAIAQTGDAYALNDFQHQRYARLAEIAAEIIRSHTSLEQAEIYHAFQQQRGYATPKVDVRAAIFQEGKLLMVQEKTDDGWTLPGGWADVGDLPSQAAEREAWEEAGVTVRARRLVGLYDANRTGELELFHAYKLVFLCDFLSGTPKAGEETRAVAFFDRDQLPSILSGERTLPRHIEDAFACQQNSDLPVVFD
jgi:ADP-ribose pyrophosphatase YjhB (NUDIX family)